MTDFALSSGSIMRPYRSPWGAFPTRGMAISTGISTLVIRVGTVVGLDVNSTAYQNCIVPSSISSGTLLSTAIVGVAAENPASAAGSTNGQGQVIPVWEANPNVEFKIATIGGLLNSTMVGQLRDLQWDSTLMIQVVTCGASRLTTAMPRVIVTGLLDASGDSGGYITVRFIPNDPVGSTARALAFYG